MVSNQDLIKAVFNDDNIIKYNKWFFKADWKKAEIVSLETEHDWLRIKNIIWYNGIWENGAWKYGYWMNGTWYDGVWEDGYWENGTWENGTWKNGWWYNGTWENGKWYKGVWKRGIWKNGTWKNGKIYDSKTKKYIESTVPPNECKWSLSYGKK